jgi:anti-sigma regulatory factor (Ser/Thr protein kinase)
MRRDGGCRVIRRFPAHPAALGEIRRFVRREAREATLGMERAEELTLAVSEACANSIRHAGTHEIRLDCRREGQCVVVDIEDQGVFKDRFPVPEFDHGGRGILLMTAFVDELAIREGTRDSPGTRVRLVKCKQDFATRTGPAGAW